MLREKVAYKYVGILEQDIIKQAEKKEKIKKEKRMLQKNETTF